LEFPAVSEIDTSELATFPACFDLEFPAVYELVVNVIDNDYYFSLSI